jgi:protein gp37
MSTNTGIEWTDATWNPVVGCTAFRRAARTATPRRLPGSQRRDKAYLEGKRVARQYASAFEHVQEIAQRLNHPLHLAEAEARIRQLDERSVPRGCVTTTFLGRVFAVMEAATATHFRY